MKFTIFTPFFNYLETVEELYESIVNQTYPNWEWLITDDFSTDPQVKEKLLEIEKRDERIKYIETRWKKEFYYNLPVSYSTGDIILKIDSDDIPSVKILEVYKYNYEKFPDVISIGCTSIIKRHKHNSNPGASKYINYKNTSNYLEAYKQEVVSIIGDARSYKISKLKNNGHFVNDYDFKFDRGEDIHKTLIIEEWGKFFAIPRVLYHYLMRDNSNSGIQTITEESNEEKDKKQKNFEKKIQLDAELRQERKNLFSIEKYFDSSFDHAKNFFFCDLENQTKTKNIEYWSKKVCIEDMLKIDELYFDHKIYYNETIENPDMIVIDCCNGVDIISQSLESRKISNCIITLTTTNDSRQNVENILKSLGYGYWFNIFYYTTFKINL